MKITNLEGWIDVAAGTAYTAAGTTTLTSSEIDLGADFDSVLVLAKFGTAAANNTVAITSAATTGGTFAANGVTAVAAGTTNTHVALRVEGMPRDSSGNICRFFKTVCARGTSSTLEYCFAIAYSSKSGLKAPASDWTTAHSFTGYIEPTA